MAKRCPLRDSGHLDEAEGDADGGADAEGDKDPGVVDADVLELAFNPELQDGAADGQHHADFAGEDAAAGGGRRVHPLQRQYEQAAGDQINDSDKRLAAKERGHDFVGRLDLNIFSMRSVMRNPPTMLLVAAMTASIPRMNDSLLS